MSYIKFVLSKRVTGEDGGATNAVISRIESDMADTAMLETNLIMHALAARGGKVNLGFPFTFSIKLEDELSRRKFTYSLPLILK